MLITQLHYAAGLSMVSWISGIGGFVGGTSTDLVFQNTDGTFTHVVGTGLSFDAPSQTWSGSVSKLSRAMLSTPDSPGTVGITSEITYSTNVVVSVLTASLTKDFIAQLMNVPGNTNAGTGAGGNETLAGSNQIDSFNGGSGTDVVDYAFATNAISVDLSGGVANTGAAAGDTLTSIEGIRGTGLADVLRGSSGNNLLDGAGGNDTVLASAGLDTLAGGDGFDRLDMTGLAGDLTVSNFVGSTQFSAFESFVTGSGNDLIYGQSGAAEYLTSGGNDDLRLSGAGQKTADTGAGNDTISVFGADGLSLDMGLDVDRLTFVISTGLVTTITMTDVGTGTMSGAMTGTFSGVEIIESGAMRLNYHGHAGRDEVYASSGNDSIFGASGDDLIHAGNGNDLLFGDSDWGLQGGSQDYGSDMVWAEGGNDTVHASQGNDTYSGGAGTDVLSYAQLFDDFGNGTYTVTLNANSTVTKAFHDNYGDVYTETDTILQGAGDEIEVIIGTGADDTFNNASTARAFDGGAGADLFLISTANGADTVRGFGNGADLVRVSAGAASIVVLAANWTANSNSHNFGSLNFNTAGFDLNAAGLGGTSGVTLRNTLTNNGATMTGTAFADRFESASSLDVMYGGEGNDTYVCTGGNLGLIYETGASTGDLLIVDASVYLGSTIENVTLIGTAVLAHGNPSDNRMIGNDMGNVFEGVGGADTMRGGLGSDTYTYTGTETLIEAAYQAPYFDIDLGWVIDPDRDLIITSVSFVMTSTGFEDLTLANGAVDGTGNLQGNRITGNGADNSVKGQAGDDTILGAAGDDYLLGGTGNDSLRGDGWADTLRGDMGDDTLLGGSGTDMLLGGPGVNKLTGGSGADQFVFGKAVETTTVTDFVDGVDKLVFAAVKGMSEAYALSHAVQDGADVILSSTIAGMEIRVLHSTIAALAGDILIV